ncbi:unnamed protein product [Phyllotreta striolata]|uniref:Protein stoned-B-like n=1 Tax=Phyllotreta striolata TaxID=444603 RepID=A0A9N9TP79_PHYSR|nr:unnamed protein product [Phyllotreta striolata]
MHKITKGLKKKKKGKKSKKGDDELFKPEELENYRKQHQSGSEEQTVQNEEWKKFLTLTSGVDDILKKTQGDLDRIKSTSFFQRKPTESEVRKVEEEKLAEQKQREEAEKELEPPTAAELGIVEVSESESEEEEDDNIFDTAYIDALAAGEVKLAYIPESPPDKAEGDDPFDTSYAERAILGPEVERKGKKLVPLGAAVEVLTGRVQLPTCATKRPTSKRQIFKQQDLLLGSFDETATNHAAVGDAVVEDVPKTLLDEDPVPLGDEPIDLSKPIPYPQAVPVASTPEADKKTGIKEDIISEFDVIAQKVEDDDDDIEFEALAAESLHKPKTIIQELPLAVVQEVPLNSDNIKFGAFGEEAKKDSDEDLLPDADDPFDTAFVEKVLPKSSEDTSITKPPGIERKRPPRPTKNPVTNNRLNFNTAENTTSSSKALDLLSGTTPDLLTTSTNDGLSDDDFDPRADEPPRERAVSRPDVLNISNAKTVSFDLPSADATLSAESKVIKPLTPFYTRKSSIPELPASDDPFDTSFAQNITPGKAELRIIESELIHENSNDVQPKKVDQVVKTICENYNPKPASVASESIDLLSIDRDIPVKVLTPGALAAEDNEELSYRDPFDTSSVATNILPGKSELKLIESELIDSGRAIEKSDDLLVHNADEIIEKPLSPAPEVIESPIDIESEDYDPFDTSCASNLQPGKAELKLLESDEEPYVSPSSAGSNPFLLDDGDEQIDAASGFNDNPFLSQTATTMANTNPFSFDPMELEPAEAEMPGIPAVNFEQNIQQDASQPSSQIDSITTDFFSDDVPISQSVVEAIVPQKPSDLDLKYSHQTNANGPPRPPPPRPPPSKETQDLLMSVMGAMDATSSSLLGKIPPTRSPSPVNMRDLHSPSPTPEPTFGDLLDVGGKPQDLLSSEEVNNCDINQNPQQNSNSFRQAAPMVVQTQVKPPKPPPPVRPPKPPPPAVVNQTPKPPPPAEIKAIDDIDDMFGVAEPPKKKEVTKADILNLYNAPKQEPVKDLLSDDIIEPEIPAQPAVVTTNTNPPDDLPVKANLSPVAQINNENLISSEQSQEDLQMDISDNHSKGSVGSVTFNPFATVDDFTNTIQPNVDNYKPEINQNVEQTTMEIIDNTETIIPKETSPQFTNVIEPAPIPIQNDQFGFHNQSTNIFGPTITDNFNLGSTAIEKSFATDAFGVKDDFDDFEKKFDSVKHDDFSLVNSAWGNETVTSGAVTSGFGQDSGFEQDGFDEFLSLQEPPNVPQSTPNRISKTGSLESDEEKDFSVFIRPKGNDEVSTGILPTIAPPPATVTSSFGDTSPRFNPFDSQSEVQPAPVVPTDVPFAQEIKRSESQVTPPSPLFDEDVSQPLEPFPRINYTGEGWEMHLRQPNKKKITGQRFWKKIFVKLQHLPDCVLLQLYNQKDDKDPFQELPLQPCYSVSDIGAQQYDQFGKIFTLKLQYIFYKERPGVRPGQVKKAERITNKISQFAAYAIQGDYQGVKEFGSDLKKLGLPVEHAPQVSQLMKLGSLNYEDLKQFSFSIEEALFKLQAHRDRALHYKMEEVQITLVDELYVEQEADGHIQKQIARVRLFFLGFLTGMPDVELGVNDMRRQGLEVVGRHDIIPVETEEWIRLEEVDFHSCIQQEDYNQTHIIKFKPPDACYIELMRFRVRPPKNRELPLQLKAQICVTGYKVELRADVLVPGFSSRKLGQVPCEDVMIRFPIPECWIYMFRVEKHFRYGTGKIKGIERILGTMETLQESLIEVTSGQAKYEHQHRAIVWRCPRLPKEGQGAYTTHNMVCKIALTSYDQMPEKLAEYCYVEFTMPATQVSHTTCRSVSFQNSDSDEPPEKYVRYLARHEYRVGIEHTEGENPNAYASATYVPKPAPAAPAAPNIPAKVAEESSSDSE